MTNAERLATRLRELCDALEARQPVHPDAPAYPEDATDLQAVCRYNAYGLGALKQLACYAAEELDRKD